MADVFNRGVVTDESGAIGRYRSTDTQVNMEEATVKDENGNVIAVEFYNPTSEIQIEATFDTSATPPALATVNGQAITDIVVTISNSLISALNGKYFVTSQGVTEEQDGFTTYKMSLKKYLANTVPADS